MPKLFVLFASLLAAGTAIAGARETRIHYTVADRNHRVVHSATVISSITPAATRKTFLFSDGAGSDLVIRVNRNYESQTGQVTVEDPATHEKATVLVKYPFKSRTRDDSRAEGRANRSDLEKVDIPVSVTTTRGGRVEATEREWRRAGGPTLRAKAKAAVGAELAAKISRFRGVLAMPHFAEACSYLDFLGEKACQIDPSLMIATVAPACEFDARLGEPCAADQLARVRANRNRPGAY